MTGPEIRVGQTWERRRTGRRITITHITPTNLLKVDHGNGRSTHPMACTLRTDYQLIHQPEEQP